tara:strand:+ start:359 stop:1087 length:729 start_codon:yes stop_codon:yes gene_type:complete
MKNNLKFFLSRIFPPFALAFAFALPVVAAEVAITSYGHSSLLIKSKGKSVLLNPFKAVACASGLTEPKVKADVILASSELADEGAKVADGVFFVKPGSYRINGLRIEGFALPHDRIGGRRYGMSTVWKWGQAGLNFIHMGGTAAPLNPDDKVLIGRPDVLFIGVGGGSKVYDGDEAAQIVKDLNPKIVIPVQYLKDDSISGCDLSGIDSFLEKMKGTTIKKVNKTFKISKEKNTEMVIKLIK